MSPGNSQLLDLSEDFRAAALGQVDWTVALSHLAAGTGSKACELLALGSAPVQIITEISADELGAFAAANGHDPRVNSRVRVGLEAHAMKLLDERDFDTEGDSRRHPDYGEAIRRLDIPYAELAILNRTPEVTVGLTLLRTARAGVMPEDQKRLVKAALPHVLAAMKIHMAAEGRAMALTAAAFEQADCAAFILDRAGRLQSWTERGEALLCQGDLRLTNGRLHLRDPADERLGIAIERATRVRDLNDAPPSAVLNRDVAGQVYPLEIMALPSRHGFDFEAGVIILATPPSEIESRAAQVSAAVFGLTRAEAVVAGMLVAGLSAAEIATRQCVGLGTIRTHIRRLLEKTGSRNQIALVAAIFRLI